MNPDIPSDDTNQSFSGLLQDSQFPSGIVKPRHLAADSTMSVGDTYFVNAQGIFQRLATGTAGQVYTVGADGTPAYTTPAVSIPNPVTGLATVTSNFATASTSFVDVTGASVSIVTTVVCNIHVVFSGEWYNSAQHFNYLQLLRGSTVLAINVDYQDTAAAQHMISMSCLDVAVAAGSYTYKAQMKVDNGTGTLIGAAAGGDNSRLMLFAFPN